MVRDTCSVLNPHNFLSPSHKRLPCLSVPCRGRVGQTPGGAKTMSARRSTLDLMATERHY